MPQKTITHPELVAALAKPGIEILKSLTPEDAHIWHMASCICSETGELFDAIKKRVIYRQDINLSNVLEEFGDLEFYMEGLRTALDVTQEECLAANVSKLLERYNKVKYSDKEAQERKDKP